MTSEEKKNIAKLYLFCAIAVADKKIDTAEYKYISDFVKKHEIKPEKLEEGDIDLETLINSELKEKKELFVDMFQLITCDGDINPKELILLGLIADVLGEEKETYLNLLKSFKKFEKLKKLIHNDFSNYSKEELNTKKNDIKKSFPIIKSVLKVSNPKKIKKILIFGSNNKIKNLNKIEIINLFNSSFKLFEIPQKLIEKNFHFQLDSYDKIKKISKNIMDIKNLENYSHLIIGARPHYIYNGFKGSWKQNSHITKLVNKENIFEYPAGFTKSNLKTTAGKIALSIFENSINIKN